MIVPKILASAASVCLLLLAWYGSYLPVHKSHLYVSTERDIAASPHSPRDLMEMMAAALDVPSPIGQEELLVRSANTLLGTIDAYGSKSPAMVVPLVQFLEHYHDPYLAAGPGANFGLNLLMMAKVYQHAGAILHEIKYLEAAQKCLHLGLANSPTRPEFIYTLFEVDVMEGDLTDAGEMGKLIVTYWPGDSAGRARVAEGIADLEQRIRQQRGGGGIAPSQLLPGR